MNGRYCLIILCLALMMTACGKSKEDVSPVTLFLANNQTDQNCTTTAVEWFADKVEERTEGRVIIDVYNNSQLGDGIPTLEQLQYGGIDIVKTDVTVLTNFVEEYNALLMPYIYEDTEHFWKVHGGDIGMGLLRGDEMKEKGMYGLTYYDGGTRCFYNSQKEVHGPEDFKGMRIRVQESRLVMSMVYALGGEPVVTSFADVYPALQSKDVDAAENSIVNYLGESHYQVAPYFVEDNHTRSADVLVMSERTREKLSEEDLKILDDTALESWEYQKKLWAESEKAAREEAEKRGAVITELTDEELEEFRKACEPIWYSQEYIGYVDLIDRIVAAGVE